MLNLKFGRKRAELFGLDIGSAAVKVVQLREDAGGHTLVAFGVAALPFGAISDGTIKDAPAVTSAIRDAVAQSGVTTRDAAISVSGRELIIKKIQMPVVPSDELGDAVQLEAEHHIPFAIEEVFLDHQTVGQQNGNLDLILVAVKKSRVMEYVTVVEEADVNPVIVDVDSFALGNAFELSAQPEPDETVALIDIGASMMKTNVVRSGSAIFARDISFGGNQYTHAIAQLLSIPVEEAEAAKLGQHATVRWENVAPAVDEVSHDLSLEVQRTFDYFASTAESERIAKIVLSGGCAQVPGLSESLASNWGIPVEIARPFERVAVEERYAAAVAAAGPSFAVVVGLGLRRAGDKAK